MIRRPPRSTLFPYTSSSDLQLQYDIVFMAPRHGVRAMTIPNEHRIEIYARPDDDAQLLAYDIRSEEHTSELQSHSDVVCRLLLEKQNKDAHQQTIIGMHFLV